MTSLAFLGQARRLEAERDALISRQLRNAFAAAHLLARLSVGELGDLPDVVAALARDPQEIAMLVNRLEVVGEARH